MEHHDVIAECGRFSLFERACRDEAVSLTNMRFTPISGNCRVLEIVYFCLCPGN